MLDSQRLLAETDWLRALSRSLADGADAEDLCQEALLAALEGRPRVGEGLRPWLSSVVRRRSARLHRQRARRERRERTAAKPEAIPSAGELVQRAAWQREVVGVVLALAEPYRETVLLRYWQGLSTRELAAHCGVPVETARTRLKRALALLRSRLDRSRGGAMVVAGSSGAVSVSPSWLSGMCVMGLKSKLAIGAVGVLALWAIVAFWNVDPVNPEPEPAVVPTVAPLRPEVRGEAVAEDPERNAVSELPTEESPATGALRVRVVYGADERPLASVGVRVLDSRKVDRVYNFVSARTDAAGFALVPNLLPGRCDVWTDRARTKKPYRKAVIRAGETSDLVFRIPLGTDIEGVVVDPSGCGVADAEVYLSALVYLGPNITATTRSDDEGRFRIVGAGDKFQIGARAFGFSQAPMQTVISSVGATSKVRLQLGPNGGAVAGQVVNGEGAPVPGAVVSVGGAPDGSGRAMILPGLARTDADGRFRIVGLVAGDQLIVARAGGYGVWSGACAVRASMTTPVAIALDAGVVCTGVIRDSSGSPAVDARVFTGKRLTPTWFETRTDKDGRYQLSGLPSGKLEVHASLSGKGKVQAVLRGAPGEKLLWDGMLSLGIKLRGRVLFTDGEPAEGVFVSIRPGTARTDAAGWFEINNCPVGEKFTTRISDEEIESRVVDGVDPVAGEVIIRVKRAAKPSAKIVGTVLGPDGEPCADAMVYALGRGAPNTGFRPCDKTTGRFELGPLRPAEYALRVMSESYPGYASELTAVAADETWDVGVVRLVAGGRLQVTLTGEVSGAIQVGVRHEDGRFAGWLQGHRVRLSKPLAPGRYEVSVSGLSVAACTGSCAVVAGETKTLTMAVTRGTQRKIKVETPFLQAEESRSITLAVRTKAGELVLQKGTSVRGKSRVVLNCGFAPGEYGASVVCGEKRGVATFRVDVAGHDPGPVRVWIE